MLNPRVVFPCHDTNEYHNTGIVPALVWMHESFNEQLLRQEYWDSDFNVSPPKTQPEFQLIETNIKSNRAWLMSEEGYHVVFSSIPCHLWKAQESIGYGIHRLKAMVSAEKNRLCQPPSKRLAELSKN